MNFENPEKSKPIFFERHPNFLSKNFSTYIFKNFRVIEKFSPEKIGSNNDSGYLGRGFYFSTSKNTARSYQSDLDKEPKAFYLKLKNPQKGGWFSGEGYLNATKFSGDQDGAMWEHEDYDNPGETGSIEYVVKEPHQIKSATFNNGNFQHSDHVNESF